MHIVNGGHLTMVKKPVKICETYIKRLQLFYENENGYYLYNEVLKM